MPRALCYWAPRVGPAIVLTDQRGRKPKTDGYCTCIVECIPMYTVRTIIVPFFSSGCFDLPVSTLGFQRFPPCPKLLEISILMFFVACLVYPGINPAYFKSACIFVLRSSHFEGSLTALYVDHVDPTPAARYSYTSPNGMVPLPTTKGATCLFFCIEVPALFTSSEFRISHFFHTAQKIEAFNCLIIFLGVEPERLYQNPAAFSFLCSPPPFYNGNRPEPSRTPSFCVGQFLSPHPHPPLVTIAPRPVHLRAHPPRDRPAPHTVNEVFRPGFYRARGSAPSNIPPSDTSSPSASTRGCLCMILSRGGGVETNQPSSLRPQRQWLMAVSKSTPTKMAVIQHAPDVYRCGSRTGVLSAEHSFQPLLFRIAWIGALNKKIACIFI